ncbi:cytochrome c1 heme protein [Striga asiatica]|uniref:Cytochrome c1 heme protein n=1 Tax=Striga asiatica TaxID=4170 RepID=A0A5A7QRI0_STRAF|nr:cytochrome c1 heme protein [Striga asiatica]
MFGARAIHRVLREKLHAQNTVSPVFSSPCSTSWRGLVLFGAGVTGLFSFGTVASCDEAEHGVAYTEEETKAMAAEIEVVDGPNDEGEMFTRPGKLSDRFPQPYANEQAARFANGGAYPPDLSLITKARHDGQNYVFALLTGYRDPPAGISIREGLHYNPYFPGGAIAMPKMLNDGAVEYEDGTPATEAQMGKDVVSFLSWAAEPEMEERKLMGFKWIFVLSLALLQAGYYRRLKWSVLKSRKLVLDVVN